MTSWIRTRLSKRWKTSPHRRTGCLQPSAALLRAAAREEQARAQGGAGPNELAFFRSFAETFGLTEAT